jgi:twitching motility protein PilU
MADIPALLRQDVQVLFKQMIQKEPASDLATLLRLMAEKGASDLFLTCEAPPHLKIEGETYPVNAPLLKRGDVKALVYGAMSPRQITDFEATLEANLSLQIDGVGRYRVNVYFQRGDVAAVIRLIKSRIPSFEELGLPEHCAELAMLKRGLVLFCGAAGSGKSTSLAAMIGHRSANAGGHILTVEDPIEFHLPHKRALVDQREVSIDTRTFADALRNAMREAPDVIVIGEMRDAETARQALTYAETGHLCLSTLHSNNANQAIERMLNFFPEAAHKQLLMDLSLNLKAVVSQRLIPSTEGKLALATEMLLASPHVSDLIQKGRIDEIKAAMAKSTELGMHTFDQSLFDLYRAERITMEDALRNADSATDLALKIRFAEQRIPELGPVRDASMLHRRLVS